MSEEEKKSETYLGDGLYGSYDGFAITLRAPRPEGDHYVVLEPQVLCNFEDWLKVLLHPEWRISR